MTFVTNSDGNSIKQHMPSKQGRLFGIVLKARMSAPDNSLDCKTTATIGRLTNGNSCQRRGTLGKQPGIHIVAEGVEYRTDRDFVRQPGCTIAHGYFIAKPMPGNLLYDWIAEREQRALTAA